MDYFAAVKTFLRACELGSLTRAAQDLSIKTSTASRHLSELEADLRIALFNRSTRGLSLTEAGRLFRERIDDVLTRLDDAREVTAALNLTPSGVLRVTMPEAFARKHVMPHMNEFLERYKDIHVELVSSDDRLNLIECHVDLEIHIGTLQDSSLMARRLAPQQSVACATPEYLARHGLPTTPAALEPQQCLLYTRAMTHYWFARRQAEEVSDWQKIAVAGRFRSNDCNALFDAALTGMGVALLPTWLIHDAVKAGLLTVLFMEWELRYTRDEASIWAVYPPKKTVSSKVRAFIDFLAEKYGDRPDWSNSSSAP